MARQTQAERNKKQRDYQRELRARQKAERRPSRDDVARMLLHWFIVGATTKKRTKELEETEEIMVRRLVAQGFDEVASYEVFGRLVEKYTRERWNFRRKTGLLYPEMQGIDFSE